MIIEWEGTFGYGDASRAINHAMFRKHIMMEPIEGISFVWWADRVYGNPHIKYHPDDPESIMERVEFICNYFDTAHEFEITHQYKPPWKGRLHHRPRESPAYECAWWATQNPFIKSSPPKYKKIVIWTPANNVDDLDSDYKTSHKDPLSLDDWDNLYSVINILYEPIYEVVYVSYRDPIGVLFDHINTADICIGYEGIGNLIARAMWKPMIVFTEDNDLSALTSGPWATLLKSPTDILMDIENEIETQYNEIVKQERIFCGLKEQLSK